MTTLDILKKQNIIIISFFYKKNNINLLIAYLIRSKVKIIPATPLTKIYFIMVIEKAVASERGFKRDCLWRRRRDL